MYWLKGHGHTGNPTFMLVGMWCLGLVAGRGKREKGREGKGERVRIEKSGGGGRKEGKQLDFIIIPGLFIFMRTYVGHDRPTYGSAYWMCGHQLKCNYSHAFSPPQGAEHLSPCPP